MKYSFNEIKQALLAGKKIHFNVAYFNYDYVCKMLLSECDVRVGYGLKVKYDLEQVLDLFRKTVWICTKIEGEETVEQKPHKHAELIKKWADGAIIQYHVEGDEWEDCSKNEPLWDENTPYRVKPVKVNKWRWVCESTNSQLFVTEDHYSELEAYKNFNVIQKIDSTMIEVEE